MVFKSRLWPGQSMTFHFFFFEPLLCRFASVLQIIMVLKDQFLIQLLNSWPCMLIKHALIGCRMYICIKDFKLRSLWSIKVIQNHKIAMLHSWYEVLLKTSGLCQTYLCRPSKFIFVSWIYSTLFKKAWSFPVCSMANKSCFNGFFMARLLCRLVWFSLFIFDCKCMLLEHMFIHDRHHLRITCDMYHLCNMFITLLWGETHFPKFP